MCEWSLLWVDCCSPQWSLLQALGCCSRVKATTRVLNRHWSSLHLLQKGEKPDRTVLCTELLSGRLWLQRNPVQKHTHTPLLLCFAPCWDSCCVRPFFPPELKQQQLAELVSEVAEMFVAGWIMWILLGRKEGFSSLPPLLFLCEDQLLNLCPGRMSKASFHAGQPDARS